MAPIANTDDVEAVRILRRRSPQAFELARRLSLATTIDRSMLRGARLTFAAASTPEIELDVWGCSLVEHRSESQIVFSTSARQLLARDLREDDDAFAEAREFLLDVREAAGERSLAIAVEEELFALQFVGGRRARGRSRQLLRMIEQDYEQTDDRVAYAYWVEGFAARLGAEQQHLARRLTLKARGLVTRTLDREGSARSSANTRATRVGSRVRSYRRASRSAESACLVISAASFAVILSLVVPAGVAIAIGATAVLNAAISGWRGIYDLRSPRGVAAFVLDSTWASATTLAGLSAHLFALAKRRRRDFNDELSYRQNRHVYAEGVRLRPGFAVTLGNVINGVGDVRRRRVQVLVTHEDFHVWQARLFGPTYPVIYAMWMLGGVFTGVVVWIARRRQDRLGEVVESCAYYANPFEWWAYRQSDRRKQESLRGTRWGR